MILKDKAKKAVFKLEVDKISSTNGVKVITNRLDKIFLKDKIQTAYLAYEKFEKLKWPETMSTTDYIREFEKI